MSLAPDVTHDPRRTSWVASANESWADFPIQNLPYCVFRPTGSVSTGRIGVGIGDQILDLCGSARAGLLAEAGWETEAACSQATLNSLMALGSPCWRPLRRLISDLLAKDAAAAVRASAAAQLVPITDARLLMPAAIGDYTDFYASIFHATNLGRLFRPDNPLLPNYRWLPIGYHGRASSVGVSGDNVRRPNGQIHARDAPRPTFGPSRQLDFEAELGLLVGPGNGLGEPVPISRAADRIFGACLLNDWSARDIQAWEYQPLGPFLGKSFATTLSPWVVTMDALTPFRTPALARPDGQPAVLPHLSDPDDRAAGGLDISVDILLETDGLRGSRQPPERLATVHVRDLYWTVAQLVAHHTSNGCNLRPGDLLGSGTISDADPKSVGSLVELTRGGREPHRLASGESRGFLEDGDEVILRAHCERDGQVRIGFGECRARLQPAPEID